MWDSISKGENRPFKSQLSFLAAILLFNAVIFTNSQAEEMPVHCVSSSSPHPPLWLIHLGERKLTDDPRRGTNSRTRDLKEPKNQSLRKFLPEGSLVRVLEDEAIYFESWKSGVVQFYPTEVLKIPEYQVPLPGTVPIPDSYIRAEVGERQYVFAGYESNRSTEKNSPAFSTRRRNELVPLGKEKLLSDTSLEFVLSLKQNPTLIKKLSTNESLRKLLFERGLYGKPLRFEIIDGKYVSWECTDIAGNKNKKYSMQILDSDLETVIGDFVIYDNRYTWSQLVAIEKNDFFKINTYLQALYAMDSFGALPATTLTDIKYWPAKDFVEFPAKPVLYTKTEKGDLGEIYQDRKENICLDRASSGHYDTVYRQVYSESIFDSVHYIGGTFLDPFYKKQRKKGYLSQRVPNKLSCDTKLEEIFDPKIPKKPNPIFQEFSKDRFITTYAGCALAEGLKLFKSKCPDCVAQWGDLYDEDEHATHDDGECVDFRPQHIDDKLGPNQAAWISSGGKKHISTNYSYEKMFMLLDSMVEAGATTIVFNMKDTISELREKWGSKHFSNSPASLFNWQTPGHLRHAHVCFRMRQSLPDERTGEPHLKNYCQKLIDKKR